MGHINFDKGNRNTREKRFLPRIGVMPCGGIGSGNATFLNAFDRINTDEGNSPSRASFTTAATKPVEQKVTNIPDERTGPKPQLLPPRPPQQLKSRRQICLSSADQSGHTQLQRQQTRLFADNERLESAQRGGFQGNQPAGKAVADGIISAVYSDKLWGGVIEIDHGYGIISRYCGVKAGTLKKNSSVNVGDVIGWLSNVPCESKDGPHLHLEIKVNDEYVNPVEAIGRGENTAAASE